MEAFCIECTSTRKLTEDEVNEVWKLLNSFGVYEMNIADEKPEIIYPTNDYDKLTCV